ncbi:MAG TPA: S8 family serine peptidase, partial [Chitinophagaceae bacterium]|nr:S8 family serine peptidase [Chitinophagaceae bacterium]
MKPYKFLSCICLMLASLVLYSQSPTDIVQIQKRTKVAELIQKSKAQKIETEKNLQKALRYARLKNWPLVIKMQDGSTSTLIGITEDLKPMYARTLNGGAAATSRADRLYSGGGLSLSVHGEGMKAGVWDDGRARPDHQLLSGKITVPYPANNSTNTDHATHVAGTIAGADIVSNRLARGIAFEATIDDYWFGYDLSEMMIASANGLLLSNHSYTGLNEIPYYTNRASIIDDMAFDAPYYLPVFACGNSGHTSSYKVSGESISKNVIAVGNVYEQRNYTSPSSIIAYSSSSAGPSSDFRVKPEICSKGVEVYSSNATTTSSYGLQWGTSAAAPSITGTLLLLQQHYHNINSSFMLAATLKGLALHTADEAGSNPGPDIVFGWGLMNAEFAANTITHNHKSAI